MRARDFIFKEAPTLDDQQEILNNKHIRRLQNMLQPLAIIQNTCQNPGAYPNSKILSPAECAEKTEEAEEMAEVVKSYIEMLQGPQKDLTTKRDTAMTRAGRDQARLIDAKSDKDLFAKLQKLVDRFSVSLGANNTYVLSIMAIFNMKDLKTGDVDTFVDGALEGDIIDMNALVALDSGNIDVHVREQYRTVWAKVKNDFMDIKDPNATRGSIGPAEIAFILLGSPVSKAEKGDLRVGIGDNAKVYEVKASKISETTKVSKKTGKTSTKETKSGGRLTADSMPKNTDIQGRVQTLLKKYFGLKNKDVAKWSLGEGGLKQLNSWSENLAINGKKIRKRDKISRVRSFLYAFMKECMPGFKSKKNFTHKGVAAGRGDKELKPIIAGMMNSDGSVDTELNGTFMRGYMMANFLEYKGAGSAPEKVTYIDPETGEEVTTELGDKSQQHFDALLFVNRMSMHYLIIRDMNALNDALTPGSGIGNESLIKITSGATFSDPQNPAAPQLYTY